VKNYTQNAEINSKHFCYAFKTMGNLFVFYSNIATLSIPTVTDFKQPLNINI